MTPEQLVYFLKGYITAREPGLPTGDEWALLQSAILLADTPTKPCGCGGKNHD